MKIILTPVRMDAPLKLERKGNTLIFNDEVIDLSKGETCSWIVSAEKVGKEWQVLIILPHAADAPEETRFPEPITVKGDGLVNLPPPSNMENTDLVVKDDLK